jgi:undecaprenyl pyrophosphate phosphatase UppP
MKRYLIFAALVPLLGGFWLLLTTTVMSDYWSHPPSFSEAEKLVAVFASTLQFSYLFGLIPALMIGAVDDILSHVRRISPVLRMLIVGGIAFAATELVYGSRGQDSGMLQFFLYGLVGFIPATLSSWLAHRIIDKPTVA